MPWDTGEREAIPAVLLVKSCLRSGRSREDWVNFDNNCLYTPIFSLPCLRNTLFHQEPIKEGEKAIKCDTLRQ